MRGCSASLAIRGACGGGSSDLAKGSAEPCNGMRRGHKNIEKHEIVRRLAMGAELSQLVARELACLHLPGQMPSREAPALYLRDGPLAGPAICSNQHRTLVCRRA
jgi:hypothetical protein